MRIICNIIGIILFLSAMSFSETFEQVEYVTPPGWKIEKSQGTMGFVPSDVTAETATVLVLGPAENLSGKSFGQWFEGKLSEELADGSKLIQESDTTIQQNGDLKTATAARVVQDPQGATTLRIYHAVTDERQAAVAMAMSVSEEAANKYIGAIRTFFSSLRISGSSGSPPISEKGERVPEAGIVNGVPQGMFVGRSLLSGKTVCLLFLSGGRITRAVPQGGLDHFDWAQHSTNYSGDCGKWEISGNQLRILWGDGGVHEGVLTATSDGIEFYGKRYARPAVVNIAALAGKWESSLGTAAWGGEGVMLTQTLIIGADGSFHWEAGGDGMVSARATHQETRNMTGKLQISPGTISFLMNDGTVESHTFIPVPGDPLSAFALDANMFTRTQ